MFPTIVSFSALCFTQSNCSNQNKKNMIGHHICLQENENLRYLLYLYVDVS